MEIVSKGGEILSKEPNLIRLDGQVTIIGDIHGQLYDLLAIFRQEAVGCPSKSEGKVVFMGDYVDRGLYGVETALLIMMLKQCYPHKIYLLRGNHESRDLTSRFNFRDQCLEAYDEEFYDQVMEAFDQLPMAAVVNGKYFCVHGGISKNLTSLEAINQIDRKIEVPWEEGLFMDLLWADPAQYDDEIDQDFIFNEERGCSVFFGRQPTNDFLQREGLKAIVRAHECQEEGYKLHRWNGEDKPPPVITIFSAPNYCGIPNEGGVFVTGGEDGDYFISSQETDQKPYELPNVLYDDQGNPSAVGDPLCDAFSFFAPHLIGCAMDVFYHLSNSTLACLDPALTKTISQMQSTMSMDEHYIEKLIDVSKQHEELNGELEKNPSSPIDGQDSKVDETPVLSPELSHVMSINKLLNNFENELGVELDDGYLKPKRSIEQRLSLVQEINLIKTRSVAMKNSIDQKNQWLHHQNTIIGNNYQKVDKFIDIQK